MQERPVVQPGSEEDATKALAAIHEQLSTSKSLGCQKINMSKTFALSVDGAELFC